MPTAGLRKWRNRDCFSPCVLPPGFRWVKVNLVMAPVELNVQACDIENMPRFVIIPSFMIM